MPMAHPYCKKYNFYLNKMNQPWAKGSAGSLSTHGAHYVKHQKTSTPCTPWKIPENSGKFTD